MMTKEEAMNLVKQVLPCLNIDKKIREAFETLIPELKESDDERIIEEIKFAVMQMPTERQDTKERCIAWLEKQKDVSKAIEAVDRIDKYIDEHLANAHDMKDSNPDKKYYRGWDDALGKMAGILQDVYSGEKQKESLRDFIDNFPYSAEQEEQDWNKKPCLTCQEYEKGHKQGYTEGCTAGYNKAMKERTEEILSLDGNPICYKQNPAEINLKIFLTADRLASAEMTGRLKERSEILENPEKYGLQKPAEIDEYKIIKKHITEDSLSSEVNKRLKECGWYVTDTKSTEWSEEDEGELQNAIDALEFLGKKGVYKSESGYDAALQAASWLKTLPEKLSLQPKQKLNEEDEIMIGSLINYFEGDALDCSTEDVVNWLKSLRPQSKQKWSEEDSRMLSDIAGYISGVGSSSGITKRERVDFLYELPKRFNLQPKPEWSEEDEVYLQDALWCVKQATKVAKSENDMGACWSAERWLKNLSLDLKKRNEDVAKLYSNEWSEEDKQKLNRIYEILGYAADDNGFLTSKRIIGDKEAIELQDFLSSLRPHSQQE